jgi:hypothetical protein
MGGETAARTVDVKAVARNAIRVTFALAMAGSCASGDAGTVDPVVAEAVHREELCSGDFRTGVEASRIDHRHFGDALARPVSTPIVWNEFRGERELFGYAPAFNPNRLSFATNGRPIIRDRTLTLQILGDDGHWNKVPLLPVAEESLRRQGLISAANPWVPHFDKGSRFDAGPHTEERVIYDARCAAYTVVNANDSSLGESFLMYSADGGHSWAAYVIPKTEDPLYTVSLETPVNGSVLESTPALIVAEKYDVAAADGTYPRNAHKAWLLYPVFGPAGDLTLAGPFLISDHTLCCGSHSGYEAQAVSYGDHIHIAYPGDAATVDPITHRLGTPQYVRTFSRQQQRFINDPEFIGTGLLGPENQAVDAAHDAPDSHSQTALAVDKSGFIHVVMGGHGSRLVYRKSLEPDDSKQWGTPEVFSLQPKVGDHNDFADEYTYPSLVLDGYGQPNVLARWSGDAYRFRLVYTMRLNRTGAWSPQQVLLDPGRAYYGVWYHKLAIDPWGRLFVSYSYYPDNLFSDEAHTLASQYALALRIDPTPPPCVPTRLRDPKPNYCHYLGYSALGAGILIRRPGDPRFMLASTPEFFAF